MMQNKLVTLAMLSAIAGMEDRAFAVPEAPKRKKNPEADQKAIAAAQAKRERRMAKRAASH